MVDFIKIIFLMSKNPKNAAAISNTTGSHHEDSGTSFSFFWSTKQS